MERRKKGSGQITRVEGRKSPWRASIVDSSGKQTFLPDKLLGRTGFIHPGTYVEKVTLDKELSDGDTPVYIKIALRDGETGQSLGSFLVGTTLHK